MKSSEWRITVEIARVDSEGRTQSRRVEFNRENRESAFGFGVSEMQRLIYEELSYPSPPQQEEKET